LPRLIHDPRSGEMTIAAPERSLRPNAFGEGLSGLCPFCPGNEEETPPELTRVSDGDRWLLRVVPNRYPVVSHERDHELAGSHEVIIESPDHQLMIEDFSPEQLRLVLTTYRERIRLLESGAQESWIVVFKNRGADAGESIPHPHSQLVAIPFVPPRWQLSSNDGCKVCDAVDGAGELLVASSETMISMTPPWSRLPYEIVITSRQHRPRFSATTDEEIGELAPLLHQTLDALRDCHGRGFPFNWMITGNGHLAGQRHWSLSILPRLTRIGGFELASGVMINVVDPADAAARLRRAIDETSRIQSGRGGRR
jgi:UDPglucose--hexose-1-phosphate uridylyltransferase